MQGTRDARDLGAGVGLEGWFAAAFRDFAPAGAHLDPANADGLAPLSRVLQERGSHIHNTEPSESHAGISRSAADPSDRAVPPRGRPAST